MWAIDATDRHFGRRLGYRVVHAAGHGSIYPGWIMPEFLERNAGARHYIEARAEHAGGYFERNPDGYLQLVITESVRTGVKEDVDESGSEWEETL